MLRFNDLGCGVFKSEVWGSGSTGACRLDTAEPLSQFPGRP